MLSATGPARARRAAALALAGAVFLGMALVASAVPARADAVRNAQMWVLDALNVPAAWSVSQGQGVTVAVIDSGVNPDVSDLTGSVTTGPDYTGVSTPESNPNWGVHGTWMASLIAGHGHGGGGGIIGVAPKAHVLSIRVITDSTDPNYATYQHEPQTRIQNELADAIRYAVSHGAQVISMSLGYSLPSLPVRSALQDALNHNVVVVASSGNSGTATTDRGNGHAPYSFPADYPGVLGVAAIKQGGQPAGFSSDNISVQVAAPGVNVPAQGRDGQYWLVSGTSPACALTAGAARHGAGSDHQERQQPPGRRL
jgi:subtilisin family serine protease